MKMLLISALTLGISILSYASPKETLMELTTVRAKYEKVRVTFKQPIEKVFISILDNDGKLVIKRRYKIKEPITVPYDLSELPSGKYQIKIETDDDIARYDIKTEERKVVEKPLVAYGKFKDRNTVTLLVAGLEKPGVTVEIYNESNQKINSERLEVKEGFSRDYKFIHQKPDNIYFKIKDAQGRTKYVYPKS